MSTKSQLILHTGCARCLAPLSISILRLLQAEGTHRCPWCTVLLIATSDQFRLLYPSLSFDDLREWALLDPNQIQALHPDRATLANFGRLEVQGSPLLLTVRGQQR